MGTVLWTFRIALILEPLLFFFLGLQVCYAQNHVQTRASMRGVPSRIFFTGGYKGFFFIFLLVRLCPEFWTQIVSSFFILHPFILLGRVMVTCQSCEE